MGPTRTRRAGSVVVILLATCLGTSAASAAPTPDKHAEAEQLASQLDAQGRQIGMLDEQFNQARLKADQLDQQVAAINTQLASANEKLAAARDQLGRTSVDAYVHSGSAPLLAALIHANGTDLGVRKTYVDAALDDQRHALAGFTAARHHLLGLRDELVVTQHAARANANAIDANRRAAQSAIAAAQQTESKAQGDMAPLVAAAAEQQAQAQEQRVRAQVTSAPAGAALPAPAPSAAPRTATVAPGPAAPAHTTTTVHHSTPPPTTAPKPAAPSGPPPPVSGGASTAVSTAKNQLGKPYVYGGAGPDSFDCSGLTMYSWRAAGVSLPHSAEMQYSAIPHVAIDSLQPGDLVFYGSPIYHVGIYVGSGQMIEAPHTGANVRYASIYRSDLVGAGRP